LSHGFLSLHAQGLCYRDISFGNVFFDPGTGSPLICDNDNVGVDGESESGVLGTPRFMAPEVVRGEAMPSTQTDLYSLAVLIFYILLVHHPLLGRRELDYPCLDRDSDEELFGRNPLFIFDPLDASNAPDPVAHHTVLQNWELLPEYVRGRFRQAFGPGLTNPQARVRESVWRATLSRLLDGIATCTSCGKENYSVDGVAGDCWSCHREIEAPMKLRFDDRVLVLSERSRVFRHHLVRDYDYTTAVGQVVRHPERDVWGLLNVSNISWEVTVPGREPAQVPPGRAMSLVAGTTVSIDGVTARLEE
jgi:serine/threonine protein kinase